jgi:hypothetical protein
MIAIAIPFHLKGSSDNEAYEIAFRYYSRLPAIVHFCGSEGDLSRDFASPFLNDTTFYHEVPQGNVTTLSKGDAVLRQKFNDSLAVLPDSDWYCLVGADDIVPAHVFEWIAKQDHTIPTMAGMKMGGPMYVFHANNRRKIYKIRLRYKVRMDLMGGVNAFSRAAMAVCPNPYQREGCETGAELHFRDHYRVIGTDGYVIMPKVNTALNSLEKLVAFHERLTLTDADVEMVKMVIG